MSSCPWQAQDKAAFLCALHPFQNEGTNMQTLSTAFPFPAKPWSMAAWQLPLSLLL